MKVIEGGKGKREPPPKPFNPHWLAEALFKALVKGEDLATSTDQVRLRLCKLTHHRITMSQTEDVIAHVREHPFEYEWDVPHVEKGSIGEHRIYGVVLVDRDGTTHIDDRLKTAWRAGIISNLRSTGTMMKRGADCTDIMIEYLPAPMRRQFRAVGAAYDAGANMMQQALTKLA